MKELLNLAPYGIVDIDVPRLLNIDFKEDFNTIILLEFFALHKNRGLTFDEIQRFVSPYESHRAHSIFTTLLQKCATNYRIPFFIRKIKAPKTVTLYYLGDYFAKRLGLQTIPDGESSSTSFIHAGSRRGLCDRGKTSTNNPYINVKLHETSREAGLKRRKRHHIEFDDIIDRWATYQRTQETEDLQ